MPFICPSCTAVSHHPKDLEEGYCARCRAWTAPPAAAQARTEGTPELVARIVLSFGLRYPRWLGGLRYAAIRPLMFTHAIVVGHLDNAMSVDDRWCYISFEAAKAALDAWDGQGEPKGWHRHPASGRRRPEGIAELEEVRL